ncbi:MAG: regulatory protein RecX [Bacteroides sp.]|jgi:regulatory protein|nr:regulatory protein RecX [Bacteroides sp.]
MDPQASASAMLFEEFLEKGRRYCAYRDRSKKETALRLHQLGASTELSGRVLDALENEGFLNEERFARALVRGKFRNNHWGRVRILQELAHHQVAHAIIQQALTEIDEDEYLRVLEGLTRKKYDSLKGLPPFNAKGKTAQHCIGKGFEPELVWKMVNEL